MGIVYRNGRPYLYKSVRKNGRVTSEYLGSGEVALLIDQMNAMDRIELDSERSEHRAEKEAIEAAELPLKEYFARVEDLARAALLIGGYHQHQREWRKRRVERQETREHAKTATRHRDTKRTVGNLPPSGEGRQGSPDPGS